MNPRIEALPGGLTRELISEQTHLFYSPATRDVSVSFQHRPSIFSGEEFISPAGEWQALIVGLDKIAARTFGAEDLIDPVTGRSLHDVSGAGIVLLIKAAFPTLYDEAFAESNAVAEEVPT